MQERKHDTRTMLRQLRRGSVELNLMIKQLLDHFGLPRISDEQIEKVLAEEGWTHSVKSSPAATGHLSTGGPAIHRQPRAALPSRDREPR